MSRFHPTRWIEDQPVADTAVKIWLNLVKVIKYWESFCKSERLKNCSYETLVLHYKDSLMIGKFHMLQDFSKVIKWVFRQPYGSIYVRLVLKPEVVDEATAPYKLIKIS